MNLFKLIQSLSKGIRNRYMFLFDIMMCLISYMFAVIAIYSIFSLPYFLHSGLNLIALTTLTYVAVLFIFGIYRINWIYAGAKEYLLLIGSTVLSCILSFIAGLFISSNIIFPKLNLLSNSTIIVMILGIRFVIRLFYNIIQMRHHTSGKRTLVIGAGSLAVMLLRDISNNNKLDYNVIGLIDDDEKKQNTLIYNTKVIGTRNDILTICKEKNIEEIIFAIYTLPIKDKVEILDICSQTGLKVKIIPSVDVSLTDEFKPAKMREIEIEDLLDRDPIILDNKLIENDINGKTVMVTGGGGSIGSELCRQILKFKPERLIILDIYENTTYELQNELTEKYPKQKMEVLIASVRDKARLNKIFEEYRPDIVFHAAAHKHVPLMEYSPEEAIKNNVFGTYNAATCAAEYGVKRFVMISTDKAVNPTNIMGASKRMCEMIVQTLQKLGKTEFVAVRFGNVLGSHGSVVPRFKKQIAEGGPVTVTHPDITRFFMTIPEAAQLVLQAAAYARGGEIFVLDMGKPVKIYDLARKMISISGFKPDEDIKIEFTGLRPGEKLYEELLMNEEGLKKTAHSKIFVGQPIDISEAELDEKLNMLKMALSIPDSDYKSIMHEVVPTYTVDKSSTKITEEQPLVTA